MECSGVTPRADQDELQEFLEVLRDALLMVVRWIEKRRARLQAAR